MPETPDASPRHLWALVGATLVLCTACARPMLWDRSSLNRKLLLGSISMQTGLSIGGVHHAEKEQDRSVAPPKRCAASGFLRWALLMRAIK